MQRNVVILDIDYVTYDDKPVIRLFSKDGDKNIVLIELDKDSIKNIVAHPEDFIAVLKEANVLIDDTFEPYLYVVSDDIDQCVSEIKENLDVIKVEKVIKKDFQIEYEFIKVTFKHPQELAKNRDALRDLE